MIQGTIDAVKLAALHALGIGCVGAVSSPCCGQ